MIQLFKISLLGHTNFITPRIYSDKKKLDFYNQMWYYIENTNQFSLLPPCKNITPGTELAQFVYEMIYKSLKERFV